MNLMAVANTPWQTGGDVGADTPTFQHPTAG